MDDSAVVTPKKYMVGRVAGSSFTADPLFLQGGDEQGGVARVTTCLSSL